jgi:hypothetical protein
VSLRKVESRAAQAHTNLEYVRTIENLLCFRAEL